MDVLRPEWKAGDLCRIIVEGVVHDEEGIEYSLHRGMVIRALESGWTHSDVETEFGQFRIMNFTMRKMRPLELLALEAPE